LNKVQKIHIGKRVVCLVGNKEYPVSVRKMKELTGLINSMGSNLSAEI
jgi:hypothetical protein